LITVSKKKVHQRDIFRGAQSALADHKAGATRRGNIDSCWDKSY